MSIYLPEEKAFELPPAGAHTAVCARVVDLGTQPSTFGPKHQLLFGFETPDELMSDGRPFSISRRYNYTSAANSTLRADIEGWLGRALTAKDFGKLDLTDMLGRTCTLGIKHEDRNGRDYANIVSVMQRPKGTPARMSPSNGGVAFSLTDEPFAQAAYDALPQWLKDAVAQSPEYAVATGARSDFRQAPALAAPVNDLDDDIPF